MRDRPDAGRYEASINGEYAGHLEYELHGTDLVARHTEVDPTFEGEGVGSTLVRHVLDHVRDTGMRVVPTCPFVRSYIDRHPDYEDLVADGGRA